VRPALVPILLLSIPLLLSGCVSKSTFRQKADEAALLAESVRGLESEYQGLAVERDNLAGRNEELNRQLAEAREQAATLGFDLQRARSDVGRLEAVLSERGEETGKALAEMRLKIDRLETDRHELLRQAEQERLAREQRLAEMQSTQDALRRQMEEEILRGEITISELQGRLTVNLVDRILFDSGKADVKPAGIEVLKRVGEILKGVSDKEVRIEGHTDNVPISERLRPTFASNWELSAARALNVLHFLQDQVGIPGERLAANGFGEYRPLADNTTPEGRAQNRRIQIVLTPLEAKVVKPLE
jgi:chemotaxis protein MotB